MKADVAFAQKSDAGTKTVTLRLTNCTEREHRALRQGNSLIIVPTEKYAKEGSAWARALSLKDAIKRRVDVEGGPLLGSALEELVEAVTTDVAQRYEAIIADRIRDAKTEWERVLHAQEKPETERLARELSAAKATARHLRAALEKIQYLETADSVAKQALESLCDVDDYNVSRGDANEESSDPYDSVDPYL